MATLPTGGAGRTATLGTGISRSRSVAIGRPGRGTTIPTPIRDGAGSAAGVSWADGYSDFLIAGDSLLQEDGFRVLQETGERLLLEDGASTGTSNGIATVSGSLAANIDRQGLSSGVATVTGVMEEPGTADNLLKEDGDDILLETGDFLLLESGTVAPPDTFIDTNGETITDVNGEFITGV